MTPIDADTRKRPGGRMGPWMPPSDMGVRPQVGGEISRPQNRTLRQKTLCDMASTGCQGAMKTPENGRTNPSGGKLASMRNT